MAVDHPLICSNSVVLCAHIFLGQRVTASVAQNMDHFLVCFLGRLNLLCNS